MISSKKFQKPEKTKFKERFVAEEQNPNTKKQKHHDRSYYRLLKQERKEYEL